MVRANDIQMNEAQKKSVQRKQKTMTQIVESRKKQINKSTIQSSVEET